MTIGDLINIVNVNKIPLTHELVLGQTSTTPALACAIGNATLRYFEQESGEVSMPEKAEQPANAVVLWPED